MSESLSPSWFVYIIRCRNGKLYTGITTDIERRFSEHQTGARGAKFTRANPPDELIYQESCVDRRAASIREAQIKKLTRSQKLLLIATN